MYVDNFLHPIPYTNHLLKCYMPAIIRVNDCILYVSEIFV